LRRIILLFIILLFLPAYAGGAEVSVQKAVRQYVEANSSWPTAVIRVDFLSEEPEIPKHKTHITLRVESAGQYDLIGDTAFTVSFFDGATLVRTDTIRTRIEVYREVVVAAKTLPSGAIISADDLRVTKKWLRRINPQTLSIAEEAIGKKLTTQVRSGMEISAHMLKAVALVKKGKPVKIIFNTDMMQIVTVGIPEEDGSNGAIIKVRNISSNKIIYGRVVSDSAVELNI
jgi:flagella basal body P-ring formation protein FlgA